MKNGSNFRDHNKICLLSLNVYFHLFIQQKFVLNYDELKLFNRCPQVSSLKKKLYKNRKS